MAPSKRDALIEKQLKERAKSLVLHSEILMFKNEVHKQIIEVSTSCPVKAEQERKKFLDKFSEDCDKWEAEVDEWKSLVKQFKKIVGEK